MAGVCRVMTAEGCQEVEEHGAIEFNESEWIWPQAIPPYTCTANILRYTKLPPVKVVVVLLLLESELEVLRSARVVVEVYNQQLDLIIGLYYQRYSLIRGQLCSLPYSTPEGVRAYRTFTHWITAARLGPREEFTSRVTRLVDRLSPQMSVMQNSGTFLSYAVNTTSLLNALSIEASNLTSGSLGPHDSSSVPIGERSPSKKGMLLSRCRGVRPGPKDEKVSASAGSYASAGINPAAS
ncbi:hypothetical protein BV22DRAFT_1048345 [Leucogyrophana mollusca]|uniref:Uncharacterized protein n=1 Tax=Leucogyrophana mollusca TaxID=85980 RepID=A0ACB8BD19_9AGAM|nr:hypothetical protein BV22DRAFT_1048345 [Leucogyrophana mollusca]